MAGMIAMSTAPDRSASAHCEGTVNESSYLPFCGPCVNPRTSGAVFRYSTMEIRKDTRLGPHFESTVYQTRLRLRLETPQKLTFARFKTTEIPENPATPF